MDAALDTFALVMRERHPGVIALPLRNAGADEAVLMPLAGQVIRPFAAPKNRHPVINWKAGATRGGISVQRWEQRGGCGHGQLPAVARCPQ
jgi:hypothetical protein